MSSRPADVASGPPCIVEPYMQNYSHNHTGVSLSSGPMYPSFQDQNSPQRSPNSNVPVPPVRDSASLKGVNYGPGHEKFPSWPMAAAAGCPRATRAPPSGGSHRSKSWTDHTNYPKETEPPTVRPYMKRTHAVSQQQLKTVMESRDKRTPRMTLAPHNEPQIRASSPPERDGLAPVRTMSHKDLEKYARTHTDNSYPPQVVEKYMPQTQLTRADLEEYTRSYEETLTSQHIKQSSYAQSEGYHSYVSSTDSTSTPFLDRLRRDNDACLSLTSSSMGHLCSSREGRDSVATTHSCCGSVATSHSGSSSETLKWHGSLSDVSVSSSSLGNPVSSRQHIVHSARVKTPQRQNSESVVYAESGGHLLPTDQAPRARSDRQNARLFPVSTYTVKPTTYGQENSAPRSPPQPQLSVAERISELERQQSARFSLMGSSKSHKLSDPALKAIQKKALLSFYERHNHSHNSQSNNISSESRQKDVWKSEPYLVQPLQGQQPSRQREQPSSRRVSSASDYSGWCDSSGYRELKNNEQNSLKKTSPLQTNQYNTCCPACLGSSSSHTCTSKHSNKGPVILGPSISLDEWVPQRPPKNPLLRNAFVEMPQSPEPPPPSPPTVLEDEVFTGDEPFPPPPPEIENGESNSGPPRMSLVNKMESGNKLRHNPSRRNSFANAHGSHFEHRHVDVRASVRHKPMPAMTVASQVTKGLPETGEQPPPLHPRLPGHRSGHHSKASYLAHRRDKELLKLSPDHGSYKLIMSSAGEPIDCQTKKTTFDNCSLGDKSVNNSNSNILKRVATSLNSINSVASNKVESRTQCNLPDVLPIDAKAPLLRGSSIDSYSKSTVPPPSVLPRKTNIGGQLSSESYMRQHTASTDHQSQMSNHIQRGYIQSPPMPPQNDFERIDYTVQYSSGVGPMQCTSPVTLSNRVNVPQVIGSPPQNMPSPPILLASPVRTSPLVRTKSVSSPNKENSPSNSMASSPKSVHSMSPKVVQTSPSNSMTSSPKSVHSMSPKVVQASPASSQSTNSVSPRISLQSTLSGSHCGENCKTDSVSKLNNTSDAASQTEEDVGVIIKTRLLPRTKLPEEIDCELLSRELASQLSPNDRLQELLGTSIDHKEPSDYVNGLFRLEISQPVNTRLLPAVDPKNNTNRTNHPKSMEDVVGISADDLKKKKEELVIRLDRKLKVLRQEQLSVADELTLNDELGLAVGARVDRLARSSESAKYWQHIQEVAQITGLLFGLSGRLARSENLLLSVPASTTNKKSLENKRDKLQDQLKEAKNLKENIDKRSNAIAQMLLKYFSADELADYDHFINMKAKLIMDSKEIANKIQLGEEQLAALTDHVL